MERDVEQRPDPRAEHLDEPPARCERVCHRARRSGRVRVDPADGEVDRPTLLHGMREPGRERRVVAVVELHRGDVGPQVGGPPGDRRDRTAARRERAGEAGEHAGAADDDGVPGPLERCEHAGRIDVDQQALRQREHRGVHAAERELACRDASLELGKERPRVRAGKRDSRSGNRSGGSQRAERAGRHERGVDGQGDDDLVSRPAQAGDEPVHGSARRGAVVEHGERQPVLVLADEEHLVAGLGQQPRSRARRASRRETGRAPSATRSARTHRPPEGRR